MFGTLIFGYKANKNSATHSKLCTCVTFLGFIILLASNGVSYIVGRDGLA